MAAKIKEGFRDITHGVVERLKGGPKYADNLLGDSLQDQLRKATAKELLEPSEEMNSEVVDTINQDIANGKDSKEIVGLLKKRLRTDNPHKQWLAVLLVGRVMRDCSVALESHKEELLQEVARVMARPARQESSAGKDTRQAAKELLRSYGRAGTSAFRAVHRSAFENASTAAEYAAAINMAVAREAAIVVEEVKAMIDQARANTELLSEMLVAEQGTGGQQGAGTSAAGPTGDDFENELTRELVTEVRGLRSLFDAYLEQLQSMSGEPLVEEITIKALEAVDMLDGALSLVKDVACNQWELEQQATGAAAAGSGTTGRGVAAAAAAPAAGTSGTVGGSALSRDLISLDDLAEALLPQPPPVLAGNPPETATAAVAAAVAAAEKPPPIDLFAALDPVAVQAALSPGPAQAPLAAQMAGGGHPSYPSPYGAFPAQAPSTRSQPYAYAAHPQQQQLYGVYSAPAAAVNTSNPFAASAALTQPFGGPLQPAAPVSMSPPPAGPFGQAANVATVAAAAGGNPFASPQAHTGGSHASTMDSEWALFFANRTSGAPPPVAQQQ